MANLLGLVLQTALCYRKPKGIEKMGFVFGNPFAAARQDHSSETAEDYVEAVARITAHRGQCRVIDLARTFAVSSATVNRTIARLKRDGWVDVEPYGPVMLTDAGKQLAERSQLE
jgi:DtxR family transcriptional regulator, manganese transport regulator